MKSNYLYHGAEVAIIGVAARFPGADSVDEFWQNLCLQREAIRFFTTEELAEAGVAEALLQDPAYVKAKGIVRDCNAFDAAFFNYSDREAALMDPQLRLYHECAWHALEDAGYAGQYNSDRLIGVFGGASANALWTAQYAQVAEQGGAAAYEVINLISRDFFNSRLAYKLDLKGPAVTVQTACSTALVAVHQACQSLLSGDSDIALAGAVSLSLNPALAAPEQQGYLYQEGMILSPDGHCRPFDQAARGTVLSDGVGFVALRRLQDAIDDGDRIYAVIKGSAINNDGNEKIGYTAPSVSGQRDVIEAALGVAGVEAATVGYIEAHGTGTPLGDPIEIQALMQAYQGFTEAPCYVGSVKSNLGHLDTAAGMAGLMKAVMAVKQGLIPATLHFDQLNNKCDPGTQLRVVAANQEWHSHYPRRAGISSFGIGGTNAHVIIEQYITPSAPTVTADWLVLPLSAKTEASLAAYQQQLQPWLLTGQPLADIAYTLAAKRAGFDTRQGLVVDSKGTVVFASMMAQTKAAPSLYWMFSGQGAQYPQMGKGLYHSDAVFRMVLDECLGLINELNGPDIRDLLLGDDTSEVAAERLRATELTQLALFVLEYSLARLFTSWGLEAKGMLGHSLGEYVAACVAGVFSLADALKLIIARGRLMANTAAGSMVAVHQSADAIDLSEWPELAIAAINAAQNTVVSGPATVINRYTETLQARNLAFTPLRTSHAFHSALMEPILDEFAAVLGSVQLNPPQLAIMSNLTGDWVEPAAMATVGYWVAHLRQPVCFHQGLGRILHDEHAVLLEIGPGKTLAAFARQHPARQPLQWVLNSLRGAKEFEADALGPKRVAAQLYARGATIEWQTCNPVAGKVCSLPGYAFERKAYLPRFKGFNANTQLTSGEGFYREHWASHEAAELFDIQDVASDTIVLVMHSNRSDERELLQWLAACSQLITVVPGESFLRLAHNQYQLRPEIAEDYILLGKELARAAMIPARVLQLWQADDAATRYRPLAGLLLLTQAFSQLGFSDAMSIYALTEGAYRVTGDETLNADAALVYGPIRVIGQEYPHIHCHLLDIRQGQLATQATHLLPAIFSTGLPLVSAWRGSRVWAREFQALGENWQTKAVQQGFRRGGVYVITGGFGGLGTELARHLVREYQARLVLSTRQDYCDHPLLAELSALGGNAITVQIDIRDEQAVKQLLDTAISHFGEVTGIIHAAGIPGETMIMRHQLAKAVDVIATKLVPAQQTLVLTKEYALELVVFFSSVTGILGGMGQTDYCAANAMLDALAEQARAQGLRQVYSIRWDAWRETGMAVNALNGKQQILARTDHCFVGDLIAQSDVAWVFRKEITVDSCWALDEHWVMGLPTIPGTTYLDMASAAYRHTTRSESGDMAICFSDVYFLAPMSLAPMSLAPMSLVPISAESEDSADLYTQLIADDNSLTPTAFTFEVGSYHRQRQQWQLHARGQLSATLATPAPAISIAALKAQYQQRYLDNIQGAAHLGTLAMGVALSQARQDAMMKYGQRWAVVKEVWLGTAQALARLQLPDAFAGDIASMFLHPSLLDCAVSYLRAFLDGGVYIPISYQRLTQYRPLPAEFYSQVRATSALDSQLGVMSFDIQLWSVDGQLLADISEFTMRRISADFANHHPGRELPIPDFVHQFRLLPQGLTTEAGLQALDHIVRGAQPLALVAASDFAARHAQADTGDMGLFTAVPLAPQQRRPRPDISVEFIAPKTPPQQQLADIWQQMLGIERVGIQDDFFELGGDSLLLMQIHKKVQALSGSNVAVVELYNHPTIQQLADHLSSQDGEQQDTALADVSDRIEKQKAAAARRRRARQDQ